MATTWLQGAKKVDLRSTRGNGPFSNFLGVCLHVNVDENGTSDSFFAAGTATNPSSVTPNFQVYKSLAAGGVHQYLPFDYQPWCLPLDVTEVLTPAGWLPLGDVTLETGVASWSPDSGILGFNRPLHVVEPYRAETINVADVECTPDHRMYHTLVRDDGSHSVPKVTTAAELSRHPNWRVPTCGSLPVPGCGIGPDLMRLLVWTQADGRYWKGENGTVYKLVFHLSKERKIRRVCEVLDALGKDYTVRPTSAGSTRITVHGKVWIAEHVLPHLPDKRWTWDLINADAAEFAALDEEIPLADGHTGDQRTYLTAERSNADIIQALYVTHGRSAAVLGGTNFEVPLHTRRHLGRMVAKSARTGRDSALVGCLTTVDDTILIRQRGHVRVVGNCQADGNYSYAAIETAGLVNEPLTDYQLQQIAAICAVYNSEMGMPLTLANAPGQRGLITHAAGGGAWGGHPCPGTIRTAQRALILSLAKGGDVPLVKSDLDQIWAYPITSQNTGRTAPAADFLRVTDRLATVTAADVGVLKANVAALQAAVKSLAVVSAQGQATILAALTLIDNDVKAAQAGQPTGKHNVTIDGAAVVDFGGNP